MTCPFSHTRREAIAGHLCRVHRVAREASRSPWPAVADAVIELLDARDAMPPEPTAAPDPAVRGPLDRLCDRANALLRTMEEMQAVVAPPPDEPPDPTPAGVAIDWPEKLEPLPEPARDSDHVYVLYTRANALLRRMEEMEQVILRNNQPRP